MLPGVTLEVVQLTGPAAAFLAQRGRTPNARPFYLSLSFMHVHRPFGTDFDPAVAETVPVPPPLPDVPVVRRDLAALARNVAELDALVGTVLDALDGAGLARDTIVVFTTEHGVATARAKHTLYDAGIKIALLLRGPGALRPGARHDALLSNVDLLPTVLELAGLPPAVGTLGSSFAALVLGGAFTPRGAVFAEQTWGRRSGRAYYAPARCVRSGGHKYIRNFTRLPPYVDNGFLARFAADRRSVEDVARAFSAPSPKEELYDLDADPHEQRNMATDPEFADSLARLRTRLRSFLEETRDPILRGPVPNPGGAPDSPQWVPGPGGTFRLAPEDPVVEREVPFPSDPDGPGLASILWTPSD